MHPAYEATGPEAQGYTLGGVLGLPYEMTNALVRLICGRVLDRYPKLTIVAALGGGYFPYIAGRLRHFTTFADELAEAPPQPWDYVGQVKFDTNVNDVKTLRFLIESAGVENVLLGSDCSFPSAMPDPVGELRKAAPNDEAMETIAETNGDLFWDPATGKGASDEPHRCQHG